MFHVTICTLQPLLLVAALAALCFFFERRSYIQHDLEIGTLVASVRGHPCDLLLPLQFLCHRIRSLAAMSLDVPYCGRTKTELGFAFSDP